MKDFLLQLILVSLFIAILKCCVGYGYENGYEDGYRDGYEVAQNE